MRRVPLVLAGLGFAIALAVVIGLLTRGPRIEYYTCTHDYHGTLTERNDHWEADDGDVKIMNLSKNLKTAMQEVNGYYADGGCRLEE